MVDDRPNRCPSLTDERVPVMSGDTMRAPGSKSRMATPALPFVWHPEAAICCDDQRLTWQDTCSWPALSSWQGDPMSRNAHAILESGTQLDALQAIATSVRSGREFSIGRACPPGKLTGSGRSGGIRIELFPKSEGHPRFRCQTSGSTGRPKFIRRTQDSWTRCFAVNAKLWGLGSREIYAVLGALPYSIAAYGLLEGVQIGAQVEMLGGRLPSFQANRIANIGTTLIYATPTQLRLLTEACAIRRIKAVDSVLNIVVGGARLSPAIRARTRKLFPNGKIREFYGAAETSFITLADDETPAGSAGRPYPGVRIEIRDTAGKLVPECTNGEIWIRSPYLFESYTGTARDKGNWDRGALSIGEIGKLDACGNIFVRGRTTRTVSIADQTIFLEEIEHVLMSLDPVCEVAVLTASGHGRKPRLVAFVSMQENGKDRETILETCNRSLKPSLRLNQVVVMDRLPRLDSGKIDLLHLQRMIQALD